MRVLMVSTSYPRDASDWHGIFIRHLVGALVRRGDIELGLWAPPGERPNDVNAIALPHEAEWLARLMAAGGISHLMRSQRVSNLLAPITLMRMIGAGYRRQAGVDLYHINWLQCALPLPNNRVPALISVLGNDLKLLRLPLMHNLLRRVMRYRKVAICPNADWMQVPLERAFGDLAKVVPVSFGIDPVWYAIERRLSTDTPVWLTVTRLTLNKLGALFEWSESLFRHGGRELHLFGPMQEEISVPDWVHYHGAATPEQLAAEWFPRATGLITLSQHAEGRPQVVLEAMAAGLPIVASRLAGHSSLVSDGETGYFCDSPEVYAGALQRLEDITTNQRFGEAARRWAKREIGTWDDCASRYARIYRQLLGADAGD